jgi:hypothetical protein
MGSHGPKGFNPTCAGTTNGADDKGVALNDDLHVVSQAGLFNQGFWDSNASRVAYTDDARLHEWPPNDVHTM